MDRLDALKVFCAVVDAGGFSRAAAKLGISTSSVTHQVGVLEAHFGARLLNRTTRSMSLTDEGRRCVEQARRLLDEMDELEASMGDSRQQPRGTLRVDMPDILARRFVAPALPRFLAAHPELSVRLSASDRLIDMVDEGVDVMLRIGELPDSSLVGRAIFKNDYICCASPDFIARHGKPEHPDQLDGFPCLNFVYPKARQLRPWRFQRDGQPFIATPRGAVAMDHVESLIEMALAGTFRPKAIVAINGALLPIRGAPVFSPMAKLLFLNPFAPRLFAWRALSHDATRRMLRGTGSAIDERGLDLYQRLFRKPGHVEATLGMMANWDLNGLQRRIVGLGCPLVLVTGADDKAVSPSDAHKIAAKIPGARVIGLPSGGHLVHEEQPAKVTRLLLDVAHDAGLRTDEDATRLSNHGD